LDPADLLRLIQFCVWGEVVRKVGCVGMVVIFCVSESWRDRAKAVRAAAERMQDSDAKRLMAHIAEGYEHLAERREQRRKADLSRAS
jgi:hypothetical protein